jgi:hypothetical protein
MSLVTPQKFSPLRSPFFWVLLALALGGAVNLIRVASLG